MQYSSAIKAIVGIAFAFPAAAQQKSREAGASRTSSDTVYYASQVSVDAQLLPGFPAPHYPDSLQAAGLDGSVFAQWVNDTTGTPEMATFKVLRSSHPEFAKAVRQAVMGMRYTSAYLNGRKVRELIQVPFEFRAKK